MRVAGFLVGVLFLQACGGDGGEGSELIADAGTDMGDPLPTAVAEYTFASFEPWSTPIEDYQAVGDDVFPGSYETGIHDLQAYDGHRRASMAGREGTNVSVFAGACMLRFLRCDFPAMPEAGGS